jgi:cytoskeletal protein CcmA (bactofilin family)
MKSNVRFATRIAFSLILAFLVGPQAWADVLYDRGFTGAELDAEVTAGNATYPASDNRAVIGTNLQLSPVGFSGDPAVVLIRMQVIDPGVLSGFEDAVATVTVDWIQMTDDNDFGTAISDGGWAIGSLQGDQPSNWSMDSPDFGTHLAPENFNPAGGLSYAWPMTNVYNLANLGTGSSTVSATNSYGSSTTHEGLSEVDYDAGLQFLLIGNNGHEFYHVVSVHILIEASPVESDDVTPIIFGNTYVSTGAGAEIYGGILANTYITAGASTVIEGEIQTGEGVTTGATTGITGNIRAGAAITLGESTIVDGDVCHGDALTLGSGATYNYDDCSFDATAYTNNDVIAAQDSYNALTAADVVDRNQLNPTMDVDLMLYPGDGLTTITDGTTVVYNATSLTTTAGSILTLYGDYDWVFNITDMLSLGEGTKVVLAPGNEGSVTWNVGGYASIGAGAETVGTIFANGYISTGLGAKVRGALSPSVSSEPSQSYCGGLFSATSYVTIGASSTVSCE